MISVSKSSIESYLRCPAKFWRERFAPPELRRKEPTTGPLIIGRAVHTVLETLVHSARAARKTGIDNELTRARQLANIARKYDRAVTAEIAADSTGDWGRTGLNGEYTGGLAALEALAAAALAQPISGEEVPFTVELAPGMQLTGRIDAILDDGNLIDFKTQTANRFSPWRWSLAKAREDFQAPMYALGMVYERGYLPRTFTFLVAEKAAGATVEPFTVALTPAHVAWARVTALTVARAIEREAFPMPGGHPCKNCFLLNEGGCLPMKPTIGGTP